MFQRKSFGPECQPKVIGNHSVRKRSIEAGGKFNDILEFSSRVKRPPETTFLGTLQDETFQVAGDKYLASCNTDLVWAFTRMSRPLQQEPEEVDQQKQSVPSWSAFNALLFPETPCSSVVGYCPMLQGSSTELSTIYTVLKQVQKMCEVIDQKDAVITFDQAIYSKARQIQWFSPDEFKNTVIRLGGFHIALNFLALLGKKYRNSGLEDLSIESGVYAGGTTTAVMKRKSYNREVRAHKLVMEALFRIMWQVFLDWLRKSRRELEKDKLPRSVIFASVHWKAGRESRKV